MGYTRSAAKRRSNISFACLPGTTSIIQSRSNEFWEQRSVESLRPRINRQMKTGLIVDLGMMEYGAAWDLQRRLVAARKAGAVPDVLLLCEHPHVITLGRSGKLANLRASGDALRQMNVSFF